MQRPLLVAGALLALMTSPAHSAGLELAWNACYGQPGAASFVTPTCDANTGSQTMIASFRPPPGITRLEGIEVFIDFELLNDPGGCPSSDNRQTSALPCWWNFASGQPRMSELVTLHVSPADANGAPLIACDNHYFLDRGAVGAGGMLVTGLGRGQLRGLAAIAAGTGLPIAGDAQQYAMGFRILNGGTVPAGTCDGCGQWICFILNTINLVSSGVQNVVLQSPHPGSANWISWRSNITPALQPTWGQIKSIYR